MLTAQLRYGDIFFLSVSRDGSSDKTEALAKEVCAHVIPPKRMQRKHALILLFLSVYKGSMRSSYSS